MKPFQQRVWAAGLVAGLVMMIPAAAMAQDSAQGAGADLGSRLLAELTGQLDLPAVNDLRSDSRRTSGPVAARSGDKDEPALAGGPTPLDQAAQLPRPARQGPQAGPVQQASQTWQTPPPALPLPMPAPTQGDAGLDDKGGLDAGDALSGGKPMTAPAGHYGY
ncbi:hypothetical protein [Maricaulis sp.]|uniref:hypothetical protein n=1 Tax=Maricaulis sp. TaxID=1486257 RepID=UPI0025C129A8|nr:hypothetical protein [Maricaulis sp.]